MNAVAKPDIVNPRYVKFLVLVAAIFGQFFVTGYFFNPTTSQQTQTAQEAAVTSIAFAIAAALLMIPLKIIIGVFLTGQSPAEGMTREQIESGENSRSCLVKIGMVLGIFWVVGCLYGILMFSISFTDDTLKKWMGTFGLSFGIDVVGIMQLKILVTVLIGMLLLRLIRHPVAMAIAGSIAGKIVDFILAYF